MAWSLFSSDTMWSKKVWLVLNPFEIHLGIYGCSIFYSKSYNYLQFIIIEGWGFISNYVENKEWMKDNFGLRSSLFTSKEELLSMKSHKMLASRRFICLYNSGDVQQKRLTVIIVFFFFALFLLLYFINRHDLYFK